MVTDFAASSDPDALLGVLSNSRRRFVVACLEEHATPMALADLADELATREHDAPLDRVPEDDVVAIYMSLYHVHVPKLSDAGLVEYSQERDAVALAEDGDEISAFASLPSASSRGPTTN